MANSTLGTWVPPDPSVLSFTSESCANASSWMASVLRVSTDEFDFPIYGTAVLVQEGLQSWLNTNESNTRPSTAETIAWISDEEWAIFEPILTFVMNDCTRDFCEQIPWKGNPDLAGRGMLSSYIIQASMTTLYIIALAILRFSHLHPDKKAHSILYRTLSTAKHSTRPFLDTSMLFSIVMLAAAITTFARGLSRPETTTVYTKLTTSLLSLYSILPALLLQTCASPDLRRARWRRIGWLTIAALGIVVVALYAKTPLIPSRESVDAVGVDPDARNQLLREDICSGWDTSMAFKNLIWALVACLGAFSIAYIVLESVHRQTSARLIHTLRSQWWWIIASLGLAAMWTCLGLFIYFRATFDKEYPPSQESADREWTFGQILALGTWVPIVIEIGYVAVEGPRRALTGLMMEDYVAVPTRELEKLEAEEKKVESDASYDEEAVYSGVPEEGAYEGNTEAS